MLNLITTVTTLEVDENICVFDDFDTFGMISFVVVHIEVNKTD